MFNASVILHYVVNRASDNVFHIKKINNRKKSVVRDIKQNWLAIEQ